MCSMIFKIIEGKGHFLANIVKIILNTKTFESPVCDKSFKQNKHMGEKAYKCHICEFRFGLRFKKANLA